MSHNIHGNSILANVSQEETVGILPRRGLEIAGTAGGGLAGFRGFSDCTSGCIFVISRTKTIFF